MNHEPKIYFSNRTLFRAPQVIKISNVFKLIVNGDGKEALIVLNQDRAEDIMLTVEKEVSGVYLVPGSFGETIAIILRKHCN